ncbi:putative dTDP-rhamnosyl transferase [Acidimicrobium ferrooxidans DSM 10331]|uniref:Putative dTDP-rhamnosyl transferase n=1 Tax=Acidimicrobium ferrooxidans (strain DSM 10331 / JCM 15462 / NBRC 103882 / ICP) TaxID=525909 RepID=C7LY78_ACIFD|nr:glycosyltransferase [Acidimicrobium ferrooxidans]ACU53686.1 putative dTDP-rhamnosyl transferase [Acidimicrobium ferrooxidans DSM 10331]
MDELWAVVVDYGGHADDSLLDALIDAGAARVVVVDNALAVASSRTEPRGQGVVEFRSYGANLGFGGAVNRVLARRGARWLLIANPDIEIAPSALRTLLATGERWSRAGIVAPRLEDHAGQPQASVRAFPSLALAALHGALGVVWPSNPASRRYRREVPDPPNAYLAPWVSGALMLARWEALSAIGGFDASYFLYLEDVDLAWRLTRAGWEVVVDPTVRVRHVGGATTRSRRVVAALWHARSLVRYGLAQEDTATGAALVLFGVLARWAVVVVASRRSSADG